jgi:hypothetical protein
LKVGINILNNDMSESHFIPYSRAVEFSRAAFSTLSKELFIEYTKRIEKLKMPDPKSVNICGIIDVDKFMILALDQYHVMLGKVRDYIMDVFNASDMDGNRSLDFFEFYILFKIIEPKQFTFSKCCSLFNHSSEYIIENGAKVQVITFNHFANTCEAEHLFSEETQNQFLKFSKTEDYMKLVSDLKSNYSNYTKSIYDRIEKVMKNSEYLTKVWQFLKIISQKDNPREAKSAWMLYRFVDDMSKQIYIDENVEKIMGDFGKVGKAELSCKDLIECKQKGDLSFISSYS